MKAYTRLIQSNVGLANNALALKESCQDRNMSHQLESKRIRGARHAGDGRFGGPIWWNTPLREDDDEAAEEEHRTQWEQEGAQGGSEPMPSGDGALKRAREAATEEAELPEDVQARLKALRGE